MATLLLGAVVSDPGITPVTSSSIFQIILSQLPCLSNAQPSSLIPAHPRLAVNLAEDTTLYNCHEAAIVPISPSANPGPPIYLQTRDKSALLAQHREDQ